MRRVILMINNDCDILSSLIFLHNIGNNIENERKTNLLIL